MPRGYAGRVVKEGERGVVRDGPGGEGGARDLSAAVDGELRTYRASRIRDAAIEGEPAQLLPEFDLAAYWQRSEAEFRAALPRFHATIRVSPEGLGRIRMGWWRFARAEEASQPEADGWIRCRIRADTIDVAVDCVLGLGGSVEVIEPDALRAAVIDKANAAIARALEGG
jgi:predicted DNA-binding transcriptional regulator YafY